MVVQSRFAMDELSAAPFPDKRLSRRLARTVETLMKSPSASVPSACRSWGEAKGIYRFWSNRSVTAEAIRASHTLGTVRRITGSERVLIAQDTTGLDFTAHPTTQGLGYLSHPSHQGLMAHSAMALSESGVPPGLLHQQVWARDPAEQGQRHTRRQRPTDQKESQKWLTATQEVQAAVPPPPCATPSAGSPKWEASWRAKETANPASKPSGSGGGDCKKSSMPSTSFKLLTNRS